MLPAPVAWGLVAEIQGLLTYETYGLHSIGPLTLEMQ